MRKLGLPIGLLAVLQATTAHAYIGPGAGAGTFAIVLGILASIFLAFLGILWYPIKRLLNRWRAPAKTSSESDREGRDKGSGDSSARDAAPADRSPPSAGDHV